ncbi:expressed unknown protein [Seminavis robusta]|uniref:Uncharacterized protein n=1 Tax=Seminavis robusta TaxID=568900 RepID=A0A9N8H3S4_9STRA|nr:expressed unknown protein [Seminavis robusta]|eukprot:Sro94_g049140.1 n/a (257) ;mRNA; f:116251-117021
MMCPTTTTTENQPTGPKEKRDSLEGMCILAAANAGSLPDSPRGVVDHDNDVVDDDSAARKERRRERRRSDNESNHGRVRSRSRSSRRSLSKAGSRRGLLWASDSTGTLRQTHTFDGETQDAPCGSAGSLKQSHSANCLKKSSFDSTERKSSETKTNRKKRSSKNKELKEHAATLTQSSSTPNLKASTLKSSTLTTEPTLLDNASLILQQRKTDRRRRSTIDQSKVDSLGNNMRRTSLISKDSFPSLLNDLDRATTH